jgi:hypothetical protein
MDRDVLQSIALFGCVLGIGIILGGVLKAPKPEANRRKTDECDHDWRPSPTGKQCSICKITRKRDKRSWVTPEGSAGSEEN